MGTEKCYYHTFFEFQIALWLAKFINLYIKSGLFIEVASEQSSLYVDSLPLKATLSKNDTMNLQTKQLYWNGSVQTFLLFTLNI